MKISGEKLSLNDIKNIKSVLKMDGFKLNQQYKINNSNYIKISVLEGVYFGEFELVRKCAFGGMESIKSSSFFNVK